MTATRPDWSRGFHETTLVCFTAAALSGAGVAAARPLAWATGLRADDPGRGAAASVLTLICAGLLISIGHLGRPSRMMRALLRTGKNALGTEVTFAALTAAAALLLVCVPLRAAALQLLWVLASLAGLGLLASLAWVYWLPGQIAWKGVPALSVIPLGLLVGYVVHTATAFPRARPGMWGALILAALDALAWAARCARVEAGAGRGEAAHPSAMAQRRWIYVLRFLLVSLPPLAVVLFDAGLAGLVPMALGVIVDRYAFYSLAIKQTTESEVARIESKMTSDE